MKGRLVALSSAAVFAVYTAGYMKTRAAADRWTLDAPARTTTPARAGAADGANSSESAAGADTAPAVLVPPPTAASSPAPPAAHTEPRARSARHHALAAERTPVLPDAAAVESLSKPDSSSMDALLPTQSVPVTAPLPSVPAPPVDAAQSLHAEAPVAAKAPKIKDGTYLGWGTSRHGDIQAAVTIEDGKITGARIAQCLTRYSCSWIAHLPGQVISRQSADVDYVSGATQSSDAFATAIADALAKAK